jgi:hypothetical protein
MVKGSTNYAGRDAVDPDALIGKFAGEDAGELRQSAFHHAIGGSTKTTAKAGR